MCSMLGDFESWGMLRSKIGSMCGEGLGGRAKSLEVCICTRMNSDFLDRLLMYFQVQPFCHRHEMHPIAARCTNNLDFNGKGRLVLCMSSWQSCSLDAKVF